MGQPLSRMVTLSPTAHSVSPPSSETFKAQIANEVKRSQKIADLSQALGYAEDAYNYYSTYPGNQTLFAHFMRYFAIDEGDDINKQLAKLGVSSVPIESKGTNPHSSMQDKRELKGQIAAFSFGFHVLGHFVTWFIKLFINPLTPPKQPRYVA